MSEREAQRRRDWLVVHDRRVHAARLARRLQPAAVLLGGYASSRLRVRLAGERERRPSAALVAGDPPVDGIACTVPLLVVEFAPGEPGWWLAAGSREAWVLGPRSLLVHRGQRAAPTVLGPDDAARVPAVPRVRLPVSALLPPATLVAQDELLVT